MTNLERLANALEQAARSANAASQDRADARAALTVAEAADQRCQETLRAARLALANYIEGVRTHEGDEGR